MFTFKAPLDIEACLIRNESMRLHISPTPLDWPDLKLPMQPICADWTGAIDPPLPLHAEAMDPEALWLVAQHDGPPHLHPNAQAGDFIEGLWEYDVAEWFIADADGQKYMEFNLGPQGAWWCCVFDGVRTRAEAPVDKPSQVRTYAQKSPSGGWIAALVIPRAFLQQHLEVGPDCRINATAILGSPKQRFFTASDLGEGEPDFHRPDQFQTPDQQTLPQ